AAGASRGGVRALAVAAVAALALAGGGFWAVQRGLLDGAIERLPLPARASGDDRATAPAAVATTFVPLDPLTISLAADSPQRLLRLRVELEVPEAHASEVARQTGRIMDVINTYMTALDSRALTEPAALLLLRSQLLRRAQIVTGEGRVSDLLILEFVLH
ncbi:MAG: flagellar basal body-associated FliL family protein, partial [Rhodobacteraceae bacterium]|nr:flagellar basal body-associated FliL family protein [Paracoccaceae bacterium]